MIGSWTVIKNWHFVALSAIPAGNEQINGLIR
jgi:hypothetical protein